MLLIWRQILFITLWWLWLKSSVSKFTVCVIQQLIGHRPEQQFIRVVLWFCSSVVCSTKFVGQWIRLAPTVYTYMGLEHRTFVWKKNSKSFRRKQVHMLWEKRNVLSGQVFERKWGKLWRWCDRFEAYSHYCLEGEMTKERFFAHRTQCENDMFQQIGCSMVWTVSVFSFLASSQRRVPFLAGSYSKWKSWAGNIECLLYLKTRGRGNVICISNNFQNFFFSNLICSKELLEQENKYEFSSFSLNSRTKLEFKTSFCEVENVILSLPI
jgi:hypothetical protein